MAGFLSRLLGREKPPTTAREQVADQLALSRLRWLLDAPLFVDEALVRRLFDAVVRPEYDVQSRVIGEVNEEAQRRLTGGEVEGKYEHGLSFITGKGEIRGQLSHEREQQTTTGRTSETTELRVQTAGRQLEEIAAVYLTSHPDRIVFMNSDGTAKSFDGRMLDLIALEKAASDPPRMLAFVDLAPKSTILPMACELQSGETNLLFLKYIEQLWGKDDRKPVYPASDLEGDEQRAAWRAYWTALAAPFRSRTAMEIVEQAGTAGVDGHGRIGWIDFRVPIGSQGDAMHLHIVPNGEYHAGTFGYNFVRRAHNVGVRVVGTLRAGLGTDMNVLAIFDN